jgi:hypothetical protein
LVVQLAATEGEEAEELRQEIEDLEELALVYEGYEEAA